MVLTIAPSIVVAQEDEEPPIITLTQGVWFVGSFFGTLARLTLPVPRHKDEIEAQGWNHKYTGAAILTIILALIFTGLAIPTIQIPEDINTLFTLFWTAFAAGFGGNAAIIELTEYVWKKE